MRVTFVKKILADGAPCPKCDDVERRLQRSGHMARIDQVLIADPREPSSEGMRLARRHGVDVAPFFLVERDGGTTVYTVYFKFVREVLASEDRTLSKVNEAQELLRANPDLDLI